MNEANPSVPQNPNSHLSATDAGKLLSSCAAKYTAADQLQKSGALKNLPYRDPQKQKDIVVQWSTWTDPVICQMTGSPPATKEDLRKVVYKQVTEPMTPATKKKIDQGIDTIFEKVELTSAKAKDLEKPNPFAQIELTGEQGKAETPSAGQPEAVSQTGPINPVGATIAQDEVHKAKAAMSQEEFVAWLNGLIGAWANEIGKIDAEEKTAKDAGKKLPQGRKMRRDLLKQKKEALEMARDSAAPKTLDMAKALADKAVADMTVVDMGASLVDFAADLLGYKDIPLPALSSVFKGLKALSKGKKVVNAIEAAEKAAEAYEKAKELKDKAEKLKELNEKVDEVKKALKEP
jgi:hypothetical protein